MANFVNVPYIAWQVTKCVYFLGLNYLVTYIATKFISVPYKRHWVTTQCAEYRDPIFYWTTLMGIFWAIIPWAIMTIMATLSIMAIIAGHKMAIYIVVHGY